MAAYELMTGNEKQGHETIKISVVDFIPQIFINDTLYIHSSRTAAGLMSSEWQPSSARRLRKRVPILFPKVEVARRKGRLRLTLTL